MIDTVLLVFAGIAAFIWLVRNLVLCIAPRWVPELRTDTAAKLPADTPRVSLIVAAKDEEKNIPTCVRSLLAQDHPNLEVIIVDDRSSDRTAEIVTEMAKSDSRLRLIRVTELPDGWFGKAHAVHTGIGAATGEWFCLTDADCVLHDPKLVSAAAARAQSEAVDFLTLLPMIAMRTWWQKVIDPLCSGLILLAFNPLKLNNPADATGAAFAGFMMIRKSAYAAFGGHRTVAAQLGEDVELGRRAKQTGCKLRVMRHEKLFTTESYPTLRESFFGWSRVIFAALATPFKLILQLSLVLALSLGPPVAALIILALGALGLREWTDPQFQRLLAVGLGGWVLQTVATGRFFLWCGSSAWNALLYFPFSFMLSGILIHALWRFRGGANLAWRGTVYRSGQSAETLPAAAAPPAIAPTIANGSQTPLDSGAGGSKS